MIQQAVSTVHALQGKTAGSAPQGNTVLDFAAIARDALAQGTPAASGKDEEEESSPLAALLLAALFAPPQTIIDTSGDSADVQTQSNAAAGASAQGHDVTNAADAGEKLVSLLQTLGVGQQQAQSIARQLGAMLEAAQHAAPDVLAPIDSEVQRPAAWQGSQSAQTAMPAIAAATGQTAAAGGEDPIAQVRALFNKLLGDAVDAQTVESSDPSALQPDTNTVLSLRSLLADLQAARPAMAGAVQSAAQGDARREAPAGDEASADAGVAMASATTLAAVPTPATFAHNQAADAAQAPQRTLSEAFDTMVDTITTLRDSGKSEMEINLKPDFLGKVVIKLTMEEGNLVARISTSNPSVREAFQAQATQLTSALQQGGLKDVTVLVTHDMASGSALGQSTAGQQHNPREQRRRGWVMADTVEKTDAARAAAVYEQFLRNGTINYLA